MKFTHLGDPRQTTSKLVLLVCAYQDDALRVHISSSDIPSFDKPCCGTALKFDHRSAPPCLLHGPL
eukprot:CAMPEP_0183337568 /NCGR_PEP_ID=MMETSP0164_2-20130417/5157_1 /TAXON_ID=221442 /ORGANISM="Coccolithus pelagicus ssp braarudi, Strain PLY182g" /LENGTH=65 /DNA_ID=CAMNT_0025507269 /DNA_START=28 /DNA_END=225 /DNA_ORIENTATION=+